MNSPQRKSPQSMVWWIVWGAILVGLTLINAIFPPLHPHGSAPGVRYLPVIMVAMATVLRWLILPRYSGVRAFPLFVIGIAFAESCGIFGIFLVPDLRQGYFLLSVAGIVQFIPSLIAKDDPVRDQRADG